MLITSLLAGRPPARPLARPSSSSLLLHYLWRLARDGHARAESERINSKVAYAYCGYGLVVVADGLLVKSARWCTFDEHQRASAHFIPAFFSHDATATTTVTLSLISIVVGAVTVAAAAVLL